MSKVISCEFGPAYKTDVDADLEIGFGYSIFLSNLQLKNIRSFFNKFLSFLSITSIFTAIIGFTMPYFTFLLYEVKFNFQLLTASFLACFATYNLNKLTDIKEDSVNVPERAGFIEKNKPYVILATIASFSTALILAFLQKPLSIFIFLFPFFMGFIYSIKISNFRLKDITGVKNIVVAFPWAVLGTFLPLAVSFCDYTIMLLIFYFLFIKVFINTVVFDVRDIEGDRLSGVRTIPVFFGRHKTRNLLLSLNSTILLWLAFSYFMGFFHRYLIVLIFCIFYGYWYILYFCKDRAKIGTSVDLLVDGELIIIVLMATAFILF